MYKLENGNVINAPETLGNISGFPRYLEALPKDDRQAMGWYRNLVHDNTCKEPVISKDSDMIIMPISKPLEPVVDVIREKVLALREAYRQATQAFCALAGRAVCNKLEDTEYRDCAIAAYTADQVQAGMLADTLLYTLQTRRMYDGDDAWDRM